MHFIDKNFLNYYGGYCSAPSPCDEADKSDKGVLDTTTGTFTIHYVELSDEDFYYYKFGSESDTGTKYEYYLEVYGK